MATGGPEPDALAARDTIASFGGPDFVAAEGGAILPEVFGARILAVADPAGIVVGLPHRGELRMYDADGALGTIVRGIWPERAVSEGEIRSYVEHARSIHPEAIARSRAFSRLHPAFSRLLLDGDGQVWVRRHRPHHDYPPEHFHPVYEDPETWDAFDRTGRWLASVELPPNAAVMEVGRDYVLALHRDDMGIERVRQYTLRRP